MSRCVNTTSVLLFGLGISRAIVLSPELVELHAEAGRLSVSALTKASALLESVVTELLSYQVRNGENSSAEAAVSACTEKRNCHNYNQRRDSLALKMKKDMCINFV